MFLHTPLHKKLCGDERFAMESTAPKIRKHIIESDQTERIQTPKCLLLSIQSITATALTYPHRLL